MLYGNHIRCNEHGGGFMKPAVTGSEITGWGWADVAVGLFQYDAYTEVGNSPGAV